MEKEAGRKQTMEEKASRKQVESKLWKKKQVEVVIIKGDWPSNPKLGGLRQTYHCEILCTRTFPPWGLKGNGDACKGAWRWRWHWHNMKAYSCWRFKKKIGFGLPFWFDLPILFYFFGWCLFVLSSFFIFFLLMRGFCPF